MTTKITLAAALAALTLAAPAAAQERPKWGFGVSIDPFSDVFPGARAGNADATIQAYLPMQIAPNLRIEPSLGMFTNDVPTGGLDTSNITLGCGVFLTNKVAQSVDIHLGGRLKLNRASVDDGTNDDSGTDIALAAAAAGEYYFVPKFSLGLEAQLGLFKNSELSGDNSGFYTTGLGFLRVYF